MKKVCAPQPTRQLLPGLKARCPACGLSCSAQWCDEKLAAPRRPKMKHSAPRHACRSPTHDALINSLACSGVLDPCPTHDALIHSPQSGRRHEELCGNGVAGGDELWVRRDRGEGRRFGAEAGETLTFGADWRVKGKEPAGCIGMNLSGCTVLSFGWDESEALDRHQSNGRG
ncbi:hypothetical protein Droror1_Dr00022879 [Drosera rotundifolia]